MLLFTDVLSNTGSTVGMMAIVRAPATRNAGINPFNISKNILIAQLLVFCYAFINAVCEPQLSPYDRAYQWNNDAYNGTCGRSG